MGLKGKLRAEKEIKYNGDVFNDVFMQSQKDLAKITPDQIKACDVDQGEFGASGSVTVWNYVHEGKEKSFKALIEGIDEDKKTIKFKAIGGDILDLYKEYGGSVRVESNGDDHIVIWTIVYEKLNKDTPEPTWYLDFAIKMIDDIEAYHAKY